MSAVAKPTMAIDPAIEPPMIEPPQPPFDVLPPAEEVALEVGVTVLEEVGFEEVAWLEEAVAEEVGVEEVGVEEEVPEEVGSVFGLSAAATVIVTLKLRVVVLVEPAPPEEPASVLVAVILMLKANVPA